MPTGKVASIEAHKNNQKYTIGIFVESKKKKKGREYEIQKFEIAKNDFPQETQEAVMECKETDQHITINKFQSRYVVIANPTAQFQKNNEEWKGLSEGSLFGKPLPHGGHYDQDGRSCIRLHKYSDPKNQDGTIAFYTSQLPPDALDLIEKAAREKKFLHAFPHNKSHWGLQVVSRDQTSWKTKDERFALMLSKSDTFTTLDTVRKNIETGIDYAITLMPGKPVYFNLAEKDELKDATLIEENLAGRESLSKSSNISRITGTLFCGVNDKTGFIPRMVEEANQTRQPFIFGVTKNGISRCPLRHMVLAPQEGAEWRRVTKSPLFVDPQKAGELAESYGIYESHYKEYGKAYIPEEFRTLKEFKDSWKEAVSKGKLFFYQWEEGKDPKICAAYKALEIKIDKKAEAVNFSESTHYFNEEELSKFNKMKDGETISLSPNLFKDFQSSNSSYGARIAEVKQAATETKQKITFKMSIPMECTLELQELHPRVQRGNGEEWLPIPNEGEKADSLLHINVHDSKKPFMEIGIYALQNEGSVFFPRSIRERPDFQSCLEMTQKENKLLTCEWEKGKEPLFGLDKKPLRYFKTERDSQEISFHSLLSNSDSDRCAELSIGDSLSLPPNHLHLPKNAEQSKVRLDLSSIRVEARKTQQNLTIKRMNNDTGELADLQTRIRETCQETWDSFPNSDAQDKRMLLIDPHKQGDQASSLGIYEAENGDTVYFPKSLQNGERFREQWQTAEQAYRLFTCKPSENGSLAFGTALNPLLLKIEDGTEVGDLSKVEDLFPKDIRKILHEVPVGQTASLLQEGSTPVETSVPALLDHAEDLQVRTDLSSLLDQAQRTQQNLTLKRVNDHAAEISQPHTRIRETGQETWDSFPNSNAQGNRKLLIDPHKQSEQSAALGIYETESGDTVYFSQSLQKDEHFLEQRKNAEQAYRLLTCEPGKDGGLAFGTASNPLLLKIEDGTDIGDLSNVEDLFPSDFRKILHDAPIGQTVTLPQSGKSAAATSLQALTNPTKDSQARTDLISLMDTFQMTQQPLTVTRVNDHTAEISQPHSRIRVFGQDKWESFPNTDAQSKRKLLIDPRKQNEESATIGIYETERGDTVSLPTSLRKSNDFLENWKAAQPVNLVFTCDGSEHGTLAFGTASKPHTLEDLLEKNLKDSQNSNEYLQLSMLKDDLSQLHGKTFLEEFTADMGLHFIQNKLGESVNSMRAGLLCKRMNALISPREDMELNPITYYFENNRTGYTSSPSLPPSKAQKTVSPAANKLSRGELARTWGIEPHDHHKNGSSSWSRH